MTNLHIPVLLDDVMAVLDIQSHDVVVDGTVGFGGHANAILQKLDPSDSVYIGMDGDCKALRFCMDRFKSYPQFRAVHNSYPHFDAALEAAHRSTVNKLLLDLGISSVQLDQSGRGFSFLKPEEPLDMRMDVEQNSLTVSEVLNTYPKDRLTPLFLQYGEIFRPEKLVQQIVTLRKRSPIHQVSDLLDVIKSSFFFRNRRSYYLKTCAQVFQALRIEVNQELTSLSQFLEKLEGHTQVGTIIAIISFHSLEDRIVKRFVKAHLNRFKPINKKVIMATQTEVRSNSRSKSAKLRAFVRI